MNTSIVGRHVTVNDELKTHIQNTMDVFKKYNLDIVSINAIIAQEQKHGKNLITFEYILNMAHQDTIVVKQKDKDLHAAIDIATDRVCKILRRHRKELELLEDEIVPVRLKSYKPMEIEEALNSLKADGGVFKVFYDMDDNLRILYKMKDGIQFGLY
ncbi:MAG: ribosome-associated translation inhibitor RaiA [Arcobacter sp.]|nr:ribosome-associated translation inhibitor RaiA [Arcobacter sp.]